MNRPLLRVLLIEDNEDDYIIVRDLLADITSAVVSVEWVATYEEATAAFKEGQYDVCLLDYNLGGRTGLEFLQSLPDASLVTIIPVIMLTGQEDYQIDVAATEAGASDYLVKGHINTLVLERSIRYALQHKATKAALRKTRDELEERVLKRTSELELANRQLSQANKEAVKAREEAERANAAKDELLSRVSHELRTPLNAILGFGQILELEEKRLTALANESVQQILKAGRHQLALVNEILDITCIQSPDSALSVEAIALRPVIEQALDMSQPLAAAADISILHDFATIPEIPVLADEQRLLQILLNLLTNAIKYNKPDGQVILTSEVAPENRVRIHICDTGYGISAEDLPRLFVPFSRLNAESLGVEGTGLGLVLCQRLVQAMGGSLSVESRPGHGSMFSVELPMAQQNSDKPANRNALAEAAEPVVVAGAQPPRNVLLIEDNISNFRLIEMILQNDRKDLHLISAMQGSLGVELARQHRPDLILLDLHLPDIMGDEVLRRLQAHPETQDIPVIVLSADATPSQITHLLEQGVRQYLTKPIDVKQFLEAVNEILQQS